MQSISGYVYKIGSKIGSGSFGTIFNAVRNDGKKFAIKKFTKENDEFDLGTLREISVLKLLQGNQEHCIMNMEDIITWKDDFYLVMPKYPHDLDKIIKKDCLTFKQKKIIAFKIAKALAFLKHNGIVHRDIKPANILLDKDYNPVLCDFSLAKSFCGVSAEGTHTGRIATVTYRAPEVTTNKNYSFPIDSWAMGVIFYELFSKNKFTPEKDNDAFTYLAEKMSNLKENKIGTMIKQLLITNPVKRWDANDVLKFTFDYEYKPPLVWVSVKNCLVSSTIKNICIDFEIEKKVTRWAAQYYLNVTKCDPHSAVILACKFYETDLRDFTEFEEFNDMEVYIFSKMNFNLFI